MTPAAIEVYLSILVGRGGKLLGGPGSELHLGRKKKEKVRRQ